MVSLSSARWLSLTSIFLVFLSVFNLATASPLPDTESLEARGKPPFVEENLPTITKPQYQTYVDTYFKDKSKYLFYSGNSEDQVLKFIAANPGYHYYGDIFNAPNKLHPWYKMFDADKVQDDGEASSTILAENVAGVVMLFGGIEWQTKGQTSFWAVSEVQTIRRRMKAGQIQAIHHMAKGATRATQIIATEDASGKIIYMAGYGPQTKNASGADEKCKRAGSCKITPRLKPKKKSSTKCKGKRAAGSNDACPLDPSKAPVKTPAKTPAANPKTSPKTSPKKGT